MPNSPNEVPPSPVSRGGLLKYELTPVAALKPAARNARDHGKAQLKALESSLAAFGMISPVIRDANNRIVAGHGRVEAAKRAGLTMIPTLQIDHLSEAEIRLYALADNRIAERSTWNETARAEEFRELRMEVPDLDLTLSGFEHPVIELAIASLEQTDWSDLDAISEKLPADPITQLGDIWDFPNGHCLVCGDSTKPETVAIAVNGETVGLVAEDFPYNLRAKEYSGKGRHQHGDFKMAAGEMSQDQFRTFLTNSYAAVLPHLADGALLFGFMDWKHIGDLIDAGERSAFELKNIVVWDKGKGGMGALYRSAHELIAVFKHGKAPHTNNIMLGKNGRDRHNIWRYAGMNRFGRGRDRALSLHGTVKPVEMICDLMLDASQPGDVVFDGFSGSGTTLVAAEKMGRRGKVVELDPRYCDVAIDRFLLAFGEEPVARGSGLTFSETAQLRASSSHKEACDEQ